MNPDFRDPKLCICGEEMEPTEEFCSQECQEDFYEVQAVMEYTEQVLMQELHQQVV